MLMEERFRNIFVFIIQL